LSDKYFNKVKLFNNKSFFSIVFKLFLLVAFCYCLFHFYSATHPKATIVPAKMIAYIVCMGKGGTKATWHIC